MSQPGVAQTTDAAMQAVCDSANATQMELPGTIGSGCRPEWLRASERGVVAVANA